MLRCDYDITSETWHMSDEDRLSTTIHRVCVYRLVVTPRSHEAAAILQPNRADEVLLTGEMLKNFLSICLVTGLPSGAKGANTTLAETTASNIAYLYVLIWCFTVAIWTCLVWKVFSHIGSRLDLCGTRGLQFVSDRCTTWESFIFAEVAGMRADVNKIGKSYVAAVKQQFFITSAIQGFGLLLGAIHVYSSYGTSMLFPQSKRTFVNRSGMFMTGFLTLGMFCLAPFIGTEKIYKKVRPFLDVLKHLPVASFFITIIDKWWDGEYEFDDLPQDMPGWQKEMEKMNVEDDARKDLAETKEDLANYYDVKLRQDASYQLFYVDKKKIFVFYQKRTS